MLLLPCLSSPLAQENIIPFLEYKTIGVLWPLRDKVTGKYDENIFFIPTKACPNPKKLNYKRTQAAFLIQHKSDKIRADVN